MGTVHAKDPGGGNAFGDSMMSSKTPDASCADGPKKAETKTIDLQGIAARVDRVNIDGIVRTKDELVSASVKQLFQANNFEEMIKSAHEVRSKLIDLGCFRSISIHIDTSNGPSATASGYEVTYLVEELKRVTGGVTTHVATTKNEGMLSVTMALPNMFGAGEKLYGEYSHGSRKTQNFNLTFVKPVISDWNLRPSLSVFQNSSKWAMSGYQVTERGLLADVFFTSSPKVKHNLSWEGVWREMGVAGKNSSFQVREDSGHSLKSSLKHVISVDKRDSMIFPTCGTLLKLSSEVAGLGGSFAFIKNELNFQVNRPIVSRDFILQGAFNMGLMNPLGNEETNIHDNFFLGGPVSLRGFDFRAIGPKNSNDFVGGNYYWSAAVHLYSPLPFRPGSGGFGDLFRSHVFINAGNVGQFNTDNLDKWVDEQKETRVAVGLGVALRLGHMARVELNYCVPVASLEDSDGAVSGIQFGVGVNFL